MTTEPITPPARLVDAFTAGYFLAALVKNGQISVEDWNKGITLGENFLAETRPPRPRPSFQPRPPGMRSDGL